MNNPNLRQAGGTQPVDDLEVATGIGGGDNFGIGGTQMANFAILEPRRGDRLRDVIDTGTAATPCRLGAFVEFVTG